MSLRTLLNIKDLSVAFVNSKVLEGFSLSVGSGEIVAVLGANGCGKTTILNVLLARQGMNPDYMEKNQVKLGGVIDFPKNLTLSYLPQNLRRDWNPDAAGPTDYSLASTEARLTEAINLDINAKGPKELSDGQLQKLAIVKTLTAEADLYLLDEPTNYLDIDGITALEDTLGQLRDRGRGVLMVTHDRTLTDNLADRTVFITQNGVYHCRGGFSAAWELTTADFEARKKQAVDIRKRIDHLQSDVRRKFAWATSKEASKRGAGSGKPAIAKQAKKMADRAKAVQKRADREIAELKEKKPFIPKTLNLSFPSYAIKNRQVFSLREVTFSYQAAVRPHLIRKVTLGAGTTDKLCLMGANGAGKSTLFKLILGELEPLRGERNLHPSVRLRYIPQGLTGFFKHDRLLDNLLDSADETTVRQCLGAALLRKDKVVNPVSSFSQGELMRSAIVKCILERAEFLLLDEPTSHLDIESIQVLEGLLRNFQGGFLIVSHDRSFVQNVSDKLYLLEKGRVRLV